MACEKVFQVAELREIILREAVFNNDEQNVSLSTIIACRLVNRDWLETTSKCARDWQTFLVSLELRTDNQCLDKEQIVRFIKENTEARTPAQESFPQVALDIDLADHLAENGKTLENFVTKCSTKLIDLSIRFCHSHLSTPMATFPPLKSLRNLEIEVLNEPTKSEVTDIAAANMTNFIQWTLSSSDALKSVKIDLLDEGGTLNFESFILPPTLTNIKLSLFMENSDWKVITNSHLPMVRDLNLHFDYAIWKNDVVSKTLEHVCKTLRSLSLKLDFDQHAEEMPVNSVLQLPLLKELIVLKVEHSNIWDQPEPLKFCLEENLPKLKTLKLKNITATGFRKWTKDVTFQKVVDLDISVTSEDNGFATVFTLKMAQRLKLSFPTVRNLTLEMCGTQVEGLVCVFKELPQLSELHLKVSKTNEIENSDLWDALLIGAPLEFATHLRKNPELLEKMVFKENTVPSIRYLTGLRKLTLEPKERFGPHNPLISEMAFKFGFLEMPSLKTLVLQYRFKASEEMTQIWTEAGRQFTE